MTSRIGDRLDIYGPSTCPICGNRRETVFGSKAGELVCRRHPGHPLYEAELARNGGLPDSTPLGVGIAS